MLKSLWVESDAGKLLLYSQEPDEWRTKHGTGNRDLSMKELGFDCDFTTPWEGFASTGGTPNWGESGLNARPLIGWSINNPPLKLRFIAKHRQDREYINRANERIVSMFPVTGVKIYAETNSRIGQDIPDNTDDHYRYFMRWSVRGWLGDAVRTGLGGSNPASNKQGAYSLEMEIQRESPIWESVSNLAFWIADTPNDWTTNGRWRLSPLYSHSVSQSGSAVPLAQVMPADWKYSEVQIPGTGPHNFALRVFGPCFDWILASESNGWAHRVYDSSGNLIQLLQAGEQRLVDFGWKEILDPLDNDDPNRYYEAIYPMDLFLHPHANIAAQFNEGTKATRTGSTPTSTVNIVTGARVEVNPRTTHIQF